MRTEYVARPFVNTVALRDVGLAFYFIFLLGGRLLVLMKFLLLCLVVVQASFALELLSAIRTLVHDESFSVQGLVALQVILCVELPFAKVALELRRLVGQ